MGISAFLNVCFHAECSQLLIIHSVIRLFHNFIMQRSWLITGDLMIICVTVYIDYYVEIVQTQSCSRGQSSANEMSCWRCALNLPCLLEMCSLAIIQSRRKKGPTNNLIKYVLGAASLSTLITCHLTVNRFEFSRQGEWHWPAWSGTSVALLFVLSTQCFTNWS